MKKLLSFSVRYVLFWLVIFNIHRVVFLLFNSSFITWHPFGEVLLSFYHALPLDISAASYFVMVPLLLFVIFNLGGWLDTFRRVTGFYTGFLLFTVALLHGGDLAVYPEWQNKVSFTVLEHLIHPSEAVDTATSGYMLTFLITAAVQFAVGWWLYVLIVRRRLEFGSLKLPIEKLRLIGMFVVIAGLLVLGIRGGLKRFPVNVSSAYYSSQGVLNDAAVNTPWNFMNNVIDNYTAMSGNMFSYYKGNEACNTMNSLYDYPQGEHLQFLDTTRPNIVLIIMESWQADVVASDGGMAGMSPQFDKLASQGILFTNFYGNGHTSEKGNAAILSGFPAFPWASVITQPSKYREVPSINDQLKQEGYQSSYIYGGQLIYANIKGYLTDHGFDHVQDYNDVAGKYPEGEGNLGVHDEYMYKELLERIDQQKPPFLSCMFTMSTHAPYDIPNEPDTLVDWGGKFNDYCRTVRYADHALGEFIAKAKKKPWFNNTLFIFVADHGHATPRWYDYRDARRARIPFLFYGPVINDSCRGLKINKLGSQIDIAATLFSQMKIDHSVYPWSKDLMDTLTPQFAPYSFHNGFGWIRPDGWFGYEMSYKAFFPDSFLLNQHHEQLEKEGRSFFQCSFEEFQEL